MTYDGELKIQPVSIRSAIDGNLRLPDFSELEGMNYRNQLELADKMIIQKALEETKGNKTHTQQEGWVLVSAECGIR